jgi:hypothetical protein
VKTSPRQSVPEEGVMVVVISIEHAKVLAEIYSIESNGGNRQRKYGVFVYPNSAAEEEQYTFSTQQVVDFLKSKVT